MDPVFYSHKKSARRTASQNRRTANKRWQEST